MNLKQVVILCVGIWPLFLNAEVSAQQLIKISQPVWQMLTPIERELIQKKHIVELAEQDAYGIITDNQAVNESTSGTTGGANLGGAVANAAYIDSAIKGGNYSAKNQLAVGILGVILGSTLDSKPSTQYHYRYAVKLGSGSIKYFDETNNDPFRHPAGICVLVPSITLTDQQLCTQTAALLRTTYLNVTVEKAAEVSAVITPITFESTKIQEKTFLGSSSVIINCKLGTLAPVRTSVEKCELIKGSQIQ